MIVYKSIIYYLEHILKLDYKKLYCAPQNLSKYAFWSSKYQTVSVKGHLSLSRECRDKQTPTPGHLFACLQRSHFPHCKILVPHDAMQFTPKLGVFSKAPLFQPSCCVTLIVPNSHMQSFSHKLGRFNQANTTGNSGGSRGMGDAYPTSLTKKIGAQFLHQHRSNYSKKGAIFSV